MTLTVYIKIYCNLPFCLEQSGISEQNCALQVKGAKTIRETSAYAHFVILNMPLSFNSAIKPPFKSCLMHRSHINAAVSLEWAVDYNSTFFPVYRCALSLFFLPSKLRSKELNTSINISNVFIFIDIFKKETNISKKTFSL